MEQVRVRSLLLTLFAIVSLPLTTMAAKARQKSPALPSKPSLESYVESRLQDCAYSELSPEDCENEIKSSYRKAPFLSPEDFLSRLQKNKNLLQKLSVVDEVQLPQILEFLRKLRISYVEDIDGCEQRALKISYALFRDLGIKTGQVFVQGHIRLKSRHIPLESAPINWGHHIAPFILLRDSKGRVTPRSLDLTLLPETAPLVDWLQLLQRDSKELLELHALPGFQTSAPTAFEDTVNSWKDRGLDFLNESLLDAAPVIIHRGSPLRPDLAATFFQEFSTLPILKRNPYEQGYETPEPLLLTNLMTDQQMEQMRSELQKNLRCEAIPDGRQRCAYFYINKDEPGFCKAWMDLGFTNDIASIDCFPFEN